jgi:hypothetical protein
VTFALTEAPQYGAMQRIEISIHSRAGAPSDSLPHHGSSKPRWNLRRGALGSWLAFTGVQAVSSPQREENSKRKRPPCSSSGASYAPDFRRRVHTAERQENPRRLRARGITPPGGTGSARSTCSTSRRSKPPPRSTRAARLARFQLADRRFTVLSMVRAETPTFGDIARIHL